MDNEKILVELAKFFMEEFSNDPDGIADWVSQGDLDFDELYAAVKKIAHSDTR